MTPRDREAIDLARSGVTQAEIARRLGLTKNAVAGLLWRASRRGEYERGIDAEARQRAESAQAAARPDTGCRWPHGDPRGTWHYCGAPVSGPGSAWCFLHKSVVYQRAPAT